MLIESVPVGRINPAPWNPRADLAPGEAEYERIRTSLDEFGLVEPLVWNRRSGNLVGGHQRLKVLLAEGRTEVDVSVVDLDPDREKALNLALNKVSGRWDEAKLGELLDELSQVPDFDLGLTGFEAPEIDELVAGLTVDPEKEETFDVESALADDSSPVVTEPGELLTLGRHRLLCGDCTDREQVKTVMDGNRAILFATDPPYLVGYDGTNHPSAKRDRARNRSGKNTDWSGSYGITWDDADSNPDLFDRFVEAAIAEAIAPNAAWYCWHASRRQAMLEEAWERHGAFVHQQIVWAKDRPILTRSRYMWQHEPCFFGWVRGKEPPRASDEFLSTVWRIPTVPVGQSNEHPTSKPLELFEIPMKQHTRASDVCYEPFAGSGSQLIAAERLGRRCMAIEISPRYCDVIVRRWISFVGETNAPAELVERYAKSKGVTR